MDQEVMNIRLAQWSEVIKKAYASELSITEWCKQNGIRKRKFYYWTKKVRCAACDRIDEKLQEKGTSLQAVTDSNVTSIAESRANRTVKNEPVPFVEVRLSGKECKKDTGALAAVFPDPELLITSGKYGIVVRSTTKEDVLERVLRVISHVE